MLLPSLSASSLTGTPYIGVGTVAANPNASAVANKGGFETTFDLGTGGLANVF